MDANCVKEGDKVILNRNGTCRSFQIRKNRQVYFEKNKFSVEELIGQPYGSTFELDRGKLVKVDTKSFENEYNSNVLDPSTDNRDLQDSDTNQKMSKDDIMKLKEEGVTGEKIIEKLIENSETFSSKTEFSQAKFLKKKKKKHIITFSVLRPTPRLVLTIFAKEPQKICNLRADTLSQMLSFSNIMCGSNVAVVETCQGLLLSCILQRLGGRGKIIQLIPNSCNPVCRQVMDYFPFTKEELDNVYSFPMSVLEDLKKNYSNIDENLSAAVNKEEEETNSAKRLAIEKHDDPTKEEEEETNSAKKLVVEKHDDPTKEEEEETNSAKRLAIEKHDDPTEEEETNSAKRLAVEKHNDPTKEEMSPVCEEGKQSLHDGGDGLEKAVPGTDSNSGTEPKPFVANREFQRRARAIRYKAAADLIMSKKLDSLMIACKYNPAPIVKNMLQFLPFSRSVVVFCPFLEPLVQIYSYVKDNHVGLQVKLSETWLREYQVLPQRTHPMMNMSGNGGYLLTFITCDPNQPA